MTYRRADTSSTTAAMTAIPVIVPARICGSTDRGSGVPRRSARWLRVQSPYPAAAITAPSTISGTPEHMPAPGDGREGRQQLHDGQPGDHQRERRAAPSQESALVSERESRVRLGLGRGSSLGVILGRMSAVRHQLASVTYARDASITESIMPQVPAPAGPTRFGRGEQFRIYYVRSGCDCSAIALA